jgi:hypothetical protein
LISYVQEGSAVCGVITSALSEDHGSLIDPILTNDDLMCQLATESETT